MKTTLDLPDELMRTVKIRAIQENRKLKDMISHLLAVGLAQEPGDAGLGGHRVHFPLVENSHAALPEDEMTPERVAEVLLDEEAVDASAG